MQSKLTILRWHQVQTPHRATSHTAHTTDATDTRNTLRDTEPEGETERLVLVHIHTKSSSTPRFRGIYRCNQQRHPVMCTLCLFPSSQHSSLSALASASHPEGRTSQSGERDDKNTLKQLHAHILCINRSTSARQR